MSDETFDVSKIADHGVTTLKLNNLNKETIKKHLSDKAKADLHASLVEARIDELKQLWNSTQPDIVPEGAKANDMSEQLHKRIAELQSTIKTNRSI
jgi:hypothetical protein